MTWSHALSPALAQPDAPRAAQAPYPPAPSAPEGPLPAPHAAAPGAPGAAPAYPPAPLPALPPHLAVEGIELRLGQLDAERKALTRSGRPDYFLTRRIVGFVALGLGVGTLVGVGSAFLLSTFDSGATASFSRTEQVAYPTGLAVGAGLLGLGIWGLATADGDNPYRERIAALGAERRWLVRELKQARRDRKLRERYAVSADLSLQQAPRFVLRLQMRM